MIEKKTFAVRIKNLDAWFGKVQVLKNVGVEVGYHKVTAILGPSGAGKTTLLRTMNKINFEYRDFRASGILQVLGENILDRGVKTETICRRVGMLFQTPVLFPGTILHNVLVGLKYIDRKRYRLRGEYLAEKVLREVGLWSEVKDRLKENAPVLSVGQRQRLCLARVLVLDPELLLLDEPTSSLDPLSTDVIEEFIREHKKRMTFLVVTHNLAQARRVADDVIFMCGGSVCESGSARKFFKAPRCAEAQSYLANEEVSG